MDQGRNVNKEVDYPPQQRNPYATEVESQADYNKENVQTAAKHTRKKKKSSNFRKMLRKGYPKILGVVQILITFFHICLGIILIGFENSNYITYTAAYGLSLWGVPFYIISGSLSIVVGKKRNPSVSLVKAFMALNIISAIESLGVLIMFFYDVYRIVYFAANYLTTILIFIITATILQFSIAVSLSTFGGRALSVKSLPQVQSTSHVFTLPIQFNIPNTLNVQPQEDSRFLIVPSLLSEQQEISTLQQEDYGFRPDNNRRMLSEDLVNCPFCRRPLEN